jgi:GDP-L-fucose synthase
MNKKVLVTGGNGLVGSAVKDISKNKTNIDFVFVTHQEYDLTDQQQVNNLFLKYKPDYVIHTAAKVGGIGGNMIGHADYFYKNILINTHIIHNCHLHNIKKLLAFSSVCVFPDNSLILKEDMMHNGAPFEGNFAYANAKRMVDVQIRAYKSQYGHKNWCSIIPANIYGPNDLYSLSHGHVIPSLIHKLYLASKNNTGKFYVWGDGKSMREFIFSYDLAEILIKLLDFEEIPERLIVSGQQEYSIKEVVDILVKSAKFKGQIIYDSSKPNGQRKRPCDLSLLNNLFPNFKQIDLKDGLEISYKWFSDNYPQVRI